MPTLGDMNMPSVVSPGHRLDLKAIPNTVDCELRAQRRCATGLVT